MKKNLLYLFMSIFSMSLFTACSSDGDEQTQQQPIVGTWNVDPVKWDEGQLLVSGPTHMIWEASEGTMLGGMFPISSVPSMAEPVVGMLLPQVLQNVTFHADGNITASYSSTGIDMEKPTDPVWENSEIGFATYKIVSDTKMLIFLNLEKILNSTRALTPSDVAPIIGYLQNGIPVNYSINDGHLLVYIDQEVMTKLAPALFGLGDLIPEDENALGGMGAFVKAILGSLPDVMQATTRFEFGLKFSK